MGDRTEAAKDRLTRVAGAPYARGAAVALLAAAAVGQAVVQALVLGRAPAGQSFPDAHTAQYMLPLSLLALLATVPVAVYRPPMAAVAVTVGNAVALVSFGQLTAGGAVAEAAAAYWLGRAGTFSDARSVQRRYLAVGLALPFLVIALTGGGRAAVLLAAAVPAAAGLGIATWAGRLARTRTAAGEVLADTLLAHTARGERARIARELHDVVAHHISMIAVLSETGRLTTPGLPEAGARRFAEIGDTARAGLTEMRRLLGVLREDAAPAAGTPGAAGTADVAPAAGMAGAAGVAAASGLAAGASTAGASGMASAARAPAGGAAVSAGGLAGAAPASRQPQPGLAQLTELIDAARDASAAGTRLIISGPVAPLDPGVELAAYRIVQEALTNARRHAAGAAVDVELRYSPEALRVRIRDNGPGPAGPPGDSAVATRVPAPDDALVAAATRLAGDGHGLAGMRERAFSAGGSLYAGVAPGGGFLVEAVLPGGAGFGWTGLGGAGLSGAGLSGAGVSGAGVSGAGPAGLPPAATAELPSEAAR